MKDLTAEAPDFDFFQAVRLLERLGGGVRVGLDGPPANETLRLRPVASMAFAPSDVAAIEELPARDGAPARRRLTAWFLGLYGVSSPLPSSYAEWIAQADPSDTRVRDFLDLYHHRLLSLFYRAWTRHHYVALYAHDGTDPLSSRLLAWVGANAQLRLLRWASLLCGRDRPPAALAAMWSDLIGVPIHVDGNVGRWVAVPADQRARLGRAACRLGQDFVLGARVHDLSGRFRVTVGPVDFAEFERFLPGSRGRAELADVVARSLPTAFDYDVAVTLRAGSQPRLALGTPSPRRLGWSSWLGGGRSTEDTTVLFSAES
jgi:type VI secretion system protein ImpH